MAVIYNTNTVSDSLITVLDFANSKCSPKTGTSVVALSDISGNGMNYQTQNGCTVGSTGIVLDGNAGYIVTAVTASYRNAWSANGAYGPSTMTMELVFNSSDTGYIISRPWNGSGQYNYTLTQTNFGLHSNTSGTSISFSNICTGSNVHITVWMNATNFGYYINGGLGGSGSAAHGLTGGGGSSGTGDNGTLIGSLYPYGQGWAGNTGFSVAGTYYLFRQYSRVLTASEVFQNFCATRQRFGL